MGQSPVRTGSYSNITRVISYLLEPVLTGDACKDIQANAMFLRNTSHLNAMLPFRCRASQLMFMGQQWILPLIIFHKTGNGMGRGAPFTVSRPFAYSARIS